MQLPAQELVSIIIQDNRRMLFSPVRLPNRSADEFSTSVTTLMHPQDLYVLLLKIQREMHAVCPPVRQVFVMEKMEERR